MNKYSPSEQAIINALLRGLLAGRSSIPLEMLLSKKSRFTAVKNHEFATIQMTLTLLKKRGVTTSDGKGNWRLVSVPDAYLLAA